MDKVTIVISTLFIASIVVASCGGNSQEEEKQEEKRPEVEITFDVQFSEDSTEITIGNQTWMTKNLNTRTFRNGDSIPIAKSAADWEKAEWRSEPLCGYYNNNQKNEEKYGLLYNWYAAVDERGLAPDGWQVPDDSAWVQLENFFNNKEVAGHYLKSTTDDWIEDGKGNNASGFNALPSGCFSVVAEKYLEIGEKTCWWSTKSGSTAPLAQDLAAWVWSVNYYSNKFGRGDYYMGNGFSVRCIKD